MNQCIKAQVSLNIIRSIYIYYLLILTINKMKLNLKTKAKKFYSINNLLELFLKIKIN